MDIVSVKLKTIKITLGLLIEQHCRNENCRAYFVPLPRYLKTKVSEEKLEAVSHMKVNLPFSTSSVTIRQ